MTGVVYIPVTENGTLESIADISKVSALDQEYISRIVERIRSVFHGKKLAVFLRGSLAYGRFMEGISDLDMVVFSDIFSEAERESAAQIANRFAIDSKGRYSLIDISCVEINCLAQPQWNRLYLNIALTGIELFNNGLDVRYPMPVFSTELSRIISIQTINDCTQTLENIKSRTSFNYMGIPRGSDFLSVWFARDYIRGLISFVMAKKKVFSLNVETCAYEFVCCFPQYRKITERIFEAERNPICNWQSLEQLTSEALRVYVKLFNLFFQ